MGAVTIPRSSLLEKRASRSKRHAQRAYRLQKERALSTWQLAAGGIQSKLLGFKQRTAWRFKTLQDTKTAVVFNGQRSDVQSAAKVVKSTSDAADEEIHIQPRSQLEQDPSACHNVLQRVSAETLNGILSATSPENADKFCKTMTGFMIHSSSPLMRKLMLDVLTIERLDDINLTNRAIIIRAIQRFLMSPLHREKVALNTAACNILRGTHGRELSILKELVNVGADNDEQVATTAPTNAEAEAAISIGSPQRKRTRFRGRSRSEARTLPLLSSGDLTQLIYGNKNLVEIVQVMQHITKESLKVVDETRSLPLVKVVSDIDDTLFAGWLDKRYPLHILYPGVSELYRRLARRSVVNEGPWRTTPSITFLTARPRGWLNMGRYLTMQHLQTLGIPKATVLNGSVRGLGSNTNMARLKYENFVRYATLFPEFKFVFFGDSGQGDALVASRLLQEFPNQVLGAFIHDVNPTCVTTGDGQTKRFYRELGVVFFSSYLEAALICFEKDLITREDLLSVSQSAEQELRSLQFTGRQAIDLRMQRLQDFEQTKQYLAQVVKFN